MIEFTSGEIGSWVMTFFWPFVRLLAFVAAAPVFGQGSVPARIKIGLAAFVTLLVAPLLPPTDVAPASVAGAALVLQQVMIGAAFGLVMQLAFAAVGAAGEFIGLPMGLGFASFYSPASGANTAILGQLLGAFAVLLFLAFDGHLVLLDIFVRSFTQLPLAAGGLHASGWMSVAQTGAVVFTAGLSLALPLIAILLALNVAMGILNRASPQLTIFSVGFPVTLLGGLAVLTLLTPRLGVLFERLFSTLFERTLSMGASLAGS